MRQVSQCDWQVSRSDQEVSQSDVDLIIGIHAYFKLSWMVPTFLGKPKPPLPSRAVSGSQASNATWRWNWCSFLNCVRRRFFLCSIWSFFPSQSFYAAFLLYSPFIRSFYIFLFHQRIGIYDDFCIDQQGIRILASTIEQTGMFHWWVSGPSNV